MSEKCPLSACLSAALAFVSLIVFWGGCSDSSRTVTSGIVSAYRGDSGIESILSYTGRGYLKVLPVGNKVENLHLDLFQDYRKYRVQYVDVFKGDVVDKWIWINNGSQRRVWATAPEMVNRPELEYRYLDYRFPMLLDWMRKYEGEAEVNKKDDSYILEYQLAELVLKVTVGRKNRYIRRIDIEDRRNDLVFSEDYTDYRRIEGIPFPNRVRKSINSEPYCEFFTPVIRYGESPPDSVFAISAADTAGVATGGE